MSQPTENEQRVLGLAKLNHLGEFESMKKFREVMRMAQQGGKDDDPISTSVSTDFEFNGDFEQFIGDLVDAGYLDDSSGIVITKRGSNGYNSTKIPTDEFEALKKAKSLYNS